MLMYFIQASQLSTDLRLINTPPNTCEKKDTCDWLDLWQRAQGEKSAKSRHAPGALFPARSFFPFLAHVLIFTSRYTDSAAKEEQTVIYDNENQFLRFLVNWTRKAIWFNRAETPRKNKRSSQKDKKKTLQLTIMKTYGRPTRRFAMANVRTHALTKKATLLAQRLARRRVNVKMKNLSTPRSRPARKIRENNNSLLLKLPLT